MAFNDDLNTFVHNYPYTNYHELVLDFLTNLVQALKKIVDDADLEHLPERLQAIDDTLSANQLAISALESASASASQAIQDLRAITSAHTADLEAIHNEIDGVIDDLTESITALEGEFNNYRTATDSRLQALEGVAFDPSQIVMSNYPFNFALSMLNANKFGVRIVVDEAVSDHDSIQWVDGGNYAPGGSLTPNKQKFNSTFKIPMFLSSGNQCHLVIPSVFPIKYSASINWTLYFYANRYIGATSGNVGICKVGAINFTDLMAEGGYTNPNTPDANSACFNSMELFANQETGCYDLHIYNGRNGKFAWINNYMFSSMMVLPLDLGTMSQTPSIQKYFNLLNTYMIQMGTNLDNRITSAINTALAPVNTEIDGIEADAFKKSELRTLDFTPLSGVSVIANYSYQLAGVKGNERYTIAFIDMILDVTGLENNSTMNIGDLDFFFNNLSGARSLEVAIEHANNGAFGSITSGGAVAIKAYGTFDTTTRIRITASIADKYTIT